ncbi:MAG: TMEM175 family protein, partial [Candidatus Angelobacter sp.]
MEALTDGIFAIAMTLLVLELKAPELPKHVPSAQLLQALGQQIPS